MKPALIAMIALGTVGTLCFTGCDWVSEKVAVATKDSGTPDVVAKQQHREAKRQNEKWTIENQVKYPIEYCQAMLEKLERDEVKFEVMARKTNYAKKECSRKSATAQERLSMLTDYYKELKDKYKAAAASNTWPITLRGFAVDETKAGQLVLETKDKIDLAQSEYNRYSAYSRKLERESRKIIEGQRKMVIAKEKLQAQIDFLNVQNINADQDKILRSLESLNSAISLYEDELQEVNVDNMLDPDGDFAQKKRLRALLDE